LRRGKSIFSVFILHSGLRTAPPLAGLKKMLRGRRQSIILYSVLPDKNSGGVITETPLILSLNLNVPEAFNREPE
jgi:hypothetical protein